MEEKDIHNDVWLEEWNSEWPHEFHLEKECIIGALVANDHTAYVRHVGSTSIEGMPAKPIIDILVCPEKDIPLEDCIPDLERIGYRNLGECGRAGRYFLSSGDEPGKTFYVHLCYEDNPVAQDRCCSRDCCGTANCCAPSTDIRSICWRAFFRRNGICTAQ